MQRQQSGLRQMKWALCPLNPSSALQGLGFKVYMFTWKGKRATQRGPHQTPLLSTKCRLVKLQWLAVPRGREPTVPPQRFTQGGPETSQGEAQAQKAWLPNSQWNLPSLLRQKREMEEQEGESSSGERKMKAVGAGPGAE